MVRLSEFFQFFFALKKRLQESYCRDYPIIPRRMCSSFSTLILIMLYFSFQYEIMYVPVC